MDPGVQDLYGLFPLKNSKVFDRLIEGLIKAGYKPNSSNYHKVLSEQKLSHQELETLITGKTISGSAFGITVLISHPKDGPSVITMSKDGMTFVKAEGKAWINDDAVCYQHKNNWDGLKWCADVYYYPEGNQENKSEYLMLTDNSVLIPFSINQNDN